MRKFILINVLIFAMCFSLEAQQSIDELYGHDRYHRRGIHRGNKIRTSFGNDGQIGYRGNRTQSTDWPGEWPKGTNHVYLSKIVLLPMAEVRDIGGEIQHIVSESHGTGSSWSVDESVQASVGDLDVDDRWRTMTPLDGFINPALMSLPAAEASPALSDPDNRHTWPLYWPDTMKDPDDPGWPGQWNGYFGKGQIAADQESYWVADDYQNDEFNYHPDENNENRHGIGIRIAYRGLQWNNPMVEDVMYMIYDVENVGSKTLDKVNFAMLPDMDCGVIYQDWDPNPDYNVFERDEDWFYNYDRMWVENQQSTFFDPIAYAAYALFETPGNEFDGIDNDQDGEVRIEAGGNDQGKQISQADFNRGTLNSDDPVVIIDYTSYERTLTTLDSFKLKKPELFSGDTLIIDFIGRPQKFWQGKELVEIEFDNIDNNLNGLIDENNGVELDDGSFSFIYDGNLSIDYFDPDRLYNPMIDESRKDGIDNDGDWNFFDDVGLDGQRNTGDYGEGDGEASSKYEWTGDSIKVHEGTRGEPHIDATDITESDMIGMTSYFFVGGTDWQLYGLKEDEILWNVTIPGNIQGNPDEVAVSFMGSGYFPLPAGHIERFSGAFMFNDELDGLRRTKENAQIAYDENYQFYKAPERPTLSVVPGDGRVTLYWDDLAEMSVDPVNGEDFEGYRIYRSTGDQWKDPTQITDAYGENTLLKPIAQFDLANGITGLSPGVIDGIQFYLGDDSGLEHEWVDSTVVNGQRYFYTITSYDRGDAAILIVPTECNYDLDLDRTTGDIKIKTSNVVAVTPNAPSAGYKEAPSDLAIELVEGYTSSSLHYEVYDSPAIKDNNVYRVSFEDTAKTIEGYVRKQLITNSVTVENITTGTVLLDKSKRGLHGLEFPVLEGFKLFLNNPPVVEADTLSGFEREGIYQPSFQTFYNVTTGNITADDYRIEFGEVGIDTSTAFKPGTRQSAAIPVNFTITNLMKDKKIKFAFYDRDPFPANPAEAGKFSYFSGNFPWTDEIYFLEEDENGELVTTWMVKLGDSASEADTTNPVAGDVLNFQTIKPALSRDVFEFTTIAESVDKNSAKVDMEAIKVVPNPYVVSNSWERPNPYTTGRGPRELHFTHLPPRCTIRIFDIAGQHVATVERDVTLTVDGAQVWDMRTKDGLEIGFGVYIYHIEAPDIGEKVGKFAVIK